MTEQVSIIVWYTKEQIHFHSSSNEFLDYDVGDNVDISFKKIDFDLEKINRTHVVVKSFVLLAEDINLKSTVFHMFNMNPIRNEESGHSSISAGDIIQIGSKFWLIEGMGFKQLN